MCGLCHRVLEGRGTIVFVPLDGGLGSGTEVIVGMAVMVGTTVWGNGEAIATAAKARAKRGTFMLKRWPRWMDG